MARSVHYDCIRRHFRIVDWLFFFSVIWGCGYARADTRPWTLDRYQHKAWTAKDGAPTGVASLVQDTNGFIWIGSDQGMFRFDGTNFQRITELDGVDVSDGIIRPIYTGADGSLWIVSDKVGLYLFKDGHATLFTAKQGMSASSNKVQLTYDPQGNPWILADGRIYKFDGRRWIVEDPELTADDGEIQVFLFDHKGNIWAGTSSALFYRASGAAKFIPIEKSGFVVDLAERSDGSVWVSHLRGSIERWTVRGNSPTRVPGSIKTSSAGFIRFDQQGGLWINGLGDGIKQIPGNVIDADPDLQTINDHVTTFDKSKGLSGDYAWPLLVDKEGTIWVGTGGGVDRFKRSNFTPSLFPESGHNFALAAGANGSVWAGSSGKPVMEVVGDQLRTFNIPPYMLAAYSDKEANVYMAGPDGFWEMNDTGIRRLSPLPIPERSIVSAIAEDSNNVFWLSLIGYKDYGVYTWRNGQWTKINTGIPKTATVEFEDMHRRMWLGYSGDKIVVSDGAKLTLLGPNEGLTVGNVSAFVEDTHRLWVGGSDGLGYMVGLHLKTVRFEDDQPIKNITGLVFTRKGDLWIDTMDGVYQVLARDVGQAEVDPVHAMHVRKFDALDGVPGGPSANYPRPSVIQSQDGRLWFASTNGVSWVDPSQIISNHVPPPIVITSMSADQKSYTLGHDLTLPPYTRNIEIGFSVLSLTMPERVRVKVRLHGIDNDWRDLGSQRKIGYSNLSPGSYRFDVIAANNDGVWNERGATLNFSIQPAYYQTRWFKVVCICLGIVLLWLIFVLRLRQLNQQTHIRLEASHAERERIARDLHDTLLQNFPASLLLLQASINDVSNSQEREVLSDRLHKAYQVVAESREKVSQLRGAQEGELVDILSAFAVVQSRQSSLSMDVIVSGLPRSLNSDVLDQTCFIVQEAILNARAHSAGTAVRVIVEYGPRALLVRVEDNGKGIDSDFVSSGAKAGHWGLIGMKERAKQISAQLSFKQLPEGGTRVELKIPSHKAYLRKPRERLFGE